MGPRMVRTSFITGFPLTGSDSRGVRVQDRKSVESGAAGAAGVIVVLGHQQIRRRAAVGWHHEAGDDGGGIVPAERSWNLLLR